MLVLCLSIHSPPISHKQSHKHTHAHKWTRTSFHLHLSYRKCSPHVCHLPPLTRLVPVPSAMASALAAWQWPRSTGKLPSRAKLQVLYRNSELTSLKEVEKMNLNYICIAFCLDSPFSSHIFVVWILVTFCNCGFLYVQEENKGRMVQQCQPLAGPSPCRLTLLVRDFSLVET